MKKTLFAFASISLLLFTSGCVFGEKKMKEMPKEKETISIVKTGKIIPKEITIYENGTHYLKTNQREQFLLKSNVVDLSRYEDENVEIIGTSLLGEDIIEVFSVKNIESDAEKRTSLLWEETIGASIELPGTWKRQEKNGRIEYISDETVFPSISIEKISSGSTKEDILKKSTLTGNTVNVGDREGWSMMSEDEKSIEIIVPPAKTGGDMVIFYLSPQEDVNKEKAVFYEMLMGLKWEGKQEVITEIDISKKCGGVAKKLCPSGFRCELTSLDIGATGVCVDASLNPSEISSFLEVQQTEAMKKTDEKEDVVQEISEKTEKIEEDEIVVVDVSMAAEKWTTYERERLQYSFALPNSWWWKSIGPSGNSLERIQIATEEVTDENWIIGITIRKNSDTSLDIGENMFTMVVSRDNSTDYLIYGYKAYQNIIEAIAASLSSL